MDANDELLKRTDPPTSSWATRLPIRCPICRGRINGVRPLSIGMVASYECGAEYCEGYPPKPVKDCARGRTKG